MFLIRASLLLLVAFVSMSWSEDAGEDRIGTLLSMMADMRTKVGKIDTQMTTLRHFFLKLIISIISIITCTKKQLNKLQHLKGSPNSKILIDFTYKPFLGISRILFI